MILVDTSVWIDFLRDRPSPQANKLVRSITGGISVGISGIILMEIRMGIKSEVQLKELTRFLDPFMVCPNIDAQDLELAGDIYRQCRQRGMTIRKSNDCLIAAQCIRHDFQLMHSDRDFDQIAQVYDDLIAV